MSPPIPLGGPQKPFDLGGAVLSTKGGRRIPSFPPVPLSGHPAVPSASTSWCPVVPRCHPSPRRSYLGTVQEDGHSSLRGQAPALELGTRRRRHCHALGAADHPGQQQRARRKLYVAAGICLIFMLGEAVGECRVWGLDGVVVP